MKSPAFEWRINKTVNRGARCVPIWIISASYWLCRQRWRCDYREIVWTDRQWECHLEPTKLCQNIMFMDTLSIQCPWKSLCLSIDNSLILMTMVYMYKCHVIVKFHHLSWLQYESHILLINLILSIWLIRVLFHDFSNKLVKTGYLQCILMNRQTIICVFLNITWLLKYDFL